MPDDVFPIPPKDVMAAVADAYNITVSNLKSRSRQQPIDTARLVAYALLHDESRLGWTQVAAVMDRSFRSAGSIGTSARRADPDAVAALRARLHPNGHQPPLWNGDR